MATNYANVMSANASGQVTGIGNVLKVCFQIHKLRCCIDARISKT